MSPRFVRIPARILLIFAICLGVGVSPARGQLPESLEKVPGDVAFYTSSARLRQQYDAFISSNAFAKLKQMPIVQMGWGMFQAQWNSPEGRMTPVKVMLEQPENKQLVRLLGDAVSREIVFYGDEGFADLLALFNEINQANQAAQLSSIGNNDDDAAREAMGRRALEILRDRLETLTLPDAVIAFQLSDSGPALTQLARLEQIAGFMLSQQPELQGRLTREKIAGGDFLTLRLDGSLIPWDDLPEDSRDTLGELRDPISKQQLAISLGVKDDYLILSLGDTSSHLEKFGGGGLAARKEIVHLARHARRPITSVSYVSESFMTRVNSADQQIDQMVTVAEQLLPLADLDDSLRQELARDARALGEEIKAAIPRSGAVSAVEFLTDRGYEGFSFNWGGSRSLDDSRPLSILDHVGGSPLIAFAARGKYSAESHARFAKWLGRVVYYADAIGAARLDDEQRELYQRVRDDLQPLLKRLSEVTSEKLIPSFKDDSQGALVIDAKTLSKQWHESMPPSPEPLPMLELALVYGVSDADLLRQAASEYFEIVQQAIDVLHRARPDKIPAIQLPPPESRDFPGGTIYFYRLPRRLGLDSQVSPNAGLSDNKLVLSPIPKMTVRLIDAQPLRAGGPLADRERPVGSAYLFDFAGLLDAVKPWIDYGMMVAGNQLDQDVRAQIETGIEIFQCFRGISGVTYGEDETWVSHYEVHFEDLP